MLKNVSALIDRTAASFLAASDPDYKAHNSLVAAFAKATLSDYDHADIFKLSDYLETVILAFHSAWENKDRKISEEKLEKIFGEEIDLLKRIADATQYSPRLYSWAAKCHEQFIEAIYEPDFYKRRLDWPDMNLEQRKEYIAEFMHKQAEAYSMGAIPLITPELKLFGTKGSAEGYVELNKNMDENRPSSVPVWLASDMFTTQPTYKMAMLRAYHEMIHHITLQLAFAVKEGKIKQDHPLYADGVMKLARIENSGHIHGALLPIYSVDGEENLAYEQEYKLYNSCVAREQQLSPN